MGWGVANKGREGGMRIIIINARSKGYILSKQNLVVAINAIPSRQTGD